MNQDRRKHERLVLLKTFGSSAEAHNLKNALIANGIEACVLNEESNNNLGITLFGNSYLAPVELHVFESDVESARLFIKQVPDAAKVLYPEWVCQCGETIDEGFGVCWNCGTHHEDLDAEN